MGFKTARNVGTIEFWAKITEVLRLWRGQWRRWAVSQLGMIAAIDGGSAPLHKGRKQGSRALLNL
jgi:hypothetical protein